MDITTVAVEVGIAAAGVVGALLTTTYKVGSKVQALEARVETAHEKIDNHIVVDEKHHSEEQEQWRSTNRSLGQIEGALGVRKSRP